MHFTNGTSGDVQPHIALGVGLKASRYEVTVATLGEFEVFVMECGLHHNTLRGDFIKAAQAGQRQSSKQEVADPLQLMSQYTVMVKHTLKDDWESAKGTEVFIYDPAAVVPSTLQKSF
jgi:sterol 3beta-glucosyltransferase